MKDHRSLNKKGLWQRPSFISLMLWQEEVSTIIDTSTWRGRSVHLFTNKLSMQICRQSLASDLW